MEKLSRQDTAGSVVYMFFGPGRVDSGSGEIVRGLGDRNNAGTMLPSDQKGCNSAT